MRNIFMNVIYSKRRFSIVSYIKYLNFIRKLHKTTPDLSILWDIANFIKTLELVSFYDNSKNSLISSARSYPKLTENGFVVHDPRVELKYKLDLDDNLITIEINRLKGTNYKSTLRFHDGNKEIEMNRDEQELLLNIVNITMLSVEKIFKDAWKSKKVY